MFKVFISDSIYRKIITSEEKKASSERSYLYKLLKKQPVQIVTPEEETNIKNNALGIVDQNIIPLALFTQDCLDSDSSAPLETIQKTIGDFKKFYSDLASETNRETYLYAVNGKRMERCAGVKNRLLR